MICKICNKNETNSTTGRCYKCISSKNQWYKVWVKKGIMLITDDLKVAKSYGKEIKLADKDWYKNIKDRIIKKTVIKKEAYESDR